MQRIFAELAATGRFGDGIRPGDISSLLREHGQPLAVWEIRYELTQLERAGSIVLDANTGRWQPAKLQSGKRRSSA